MLSTTTNDLLYNCASQPITQNDIFSTTRSKIFTQFDLKKPEKRTQKPKTCVWLKIRNGRDLVSRDSNNLSDPYCKIKTDNCNKVHKTTIKYKTLQPEWEEVFVIPVRKADVLEIQVFDSDKAVKDEEDTSENLEKDGKEKSKPATFFNLKAAMKDALLDGDDFMGKTSIDINTMTTRKVFDKLELKNHKGIIKYNYGNLFVEYRIISAYRTH
jgi:Ca2+-dependent lipid-binding protein